MTCDNDDSLTIGPEPGGLVVKFITGDPWAASLVIEDEDGTTIAWPAAPVLEFELDPVVNVVAVLGKDDPGDVDDSMATWARTEEQVALMSSGVKVRLSVSGQTWWMGRTQCRS